MSGSLDNLKELWNRTSLVQRVLLLAIVMACLGAAFLMVDYVRKPDLAMLYSSLNPEEGGKIVEKLRDEGCAYEVRNGGTAIFVPSDKVYALRLSLASQGLPKGEQAGYRILDDEKIGASPFSQRVNYNRAIEGELSKTIGMIDGVVNARVHVAQPEASLFADTAKQTSATVVLALRSGARLSPSNVAAVVHLLAGSVEGLAPEKVVVVDAAGTLLSGEGGNELAKKAGSFLDYKGQVEQYLSRKAEEMLIAALGPGRATVRVDATIETISLNSTTETYDPQKRVITKEELKSSSTAGDAGAAGGGKEEVSTNEYLVSRTVETKSELPGQVKSLSVAAFVDLTPPASADGAAPAQAALTIEDVQAIIQNAIGPMVTAQNIKVVNTPFYKPALQADAGQDAQASRQFYLDIASRASLGLLAVGALLALKVIRKGRDKALAGAAMGGTAALAGAGAAALSAESQMDPNLLRARITRALQDNPEEVKRLFTNWVESDKGEV